MILAADADFNARVVVPMSFSVARVDRKAEPVYNES
jgi:hypothetical protein